jgi:hypothetical protein
MFSWFKGKSWPPNTGAAVARNSDDSRLWKGASEPAQRFYGRKKEKWGQEE